MSRTKHSPVEHDDKGCEEEQESLLKTDASSIDAESNFLSIRIVGDSAYNAYNLLQISLRRPRLQSLDSDKNVPVREMPQYQGIQIRGLGAWL